MRGQIIGTLNLFSHYAGALLAADAAIAQALADVATIGILQARTIRNAHLLAEQLQYALDSRVLIEQAKGVLAATHQVTVDVAFALLRSHARSHNLPLRQVADEVVSRRLVIDRVQQ